MRCPMHPMAYARHSAVRFSHQQHLHLPCLPPKNPPSGLNLTKISLPARTSFVVRTYILTPALSPTNSAFRCTWQQVLLTFPPPGLGTSPRLCGPSASLTTYVAPASHSQSGSAVGCSSQARTRVTWAMTFDSNRGPVTEKNWPNFYVVLGQLKHPKLVKYLSSKYPTCMLRLEHACLRGNTLQRHDSSARARSVASRYAGQRLSACAGHMCACRGQYLQQLPTRRWQRAPGTARTAWRAVDGAFNSSLACALVECAARVQ